MARTGRWRGVTCEECLDPTDHHLWLYLLLLLLSLQQTTLRQHDLIDEPLGGFLLLDKVIFDRHVAFSSLNKQTKQRNKLIFLFE